MTEVAFVDHVAASDQTSGDVAASPVRERIQALDVIRGVAVGGILLANVMVFFGLFVIPGARAAALPTAAADNIVRFLEHLFVDGKFYSMFSLLFGIGFGVQVSRGGDAAVPRFRRRLRILLGIGAIHALLIWAGDILLVYALLGFTMPWFARKSDGTLLRWVLGLWTVRAGIALSPAAHRATLVRWSLLGWSIGLPANLIAAWSTEHWPYLMPSVGGLLGVVMQAIGVPMLALGYAATIALLVVDRPRVLAVFGPVGLMALTNYLMHSILCVVLSYGFGFGLWWRVGASRAMMIAAAIIAVQIPLSAWWLSRYRFGPVEWVWRSLTYGRPI